MRRRGKGLRWLAAAAVLAALGIAVVVVIALGRSPETPPQTAPLPSSASGTASAAPVDPGPATLDPAASAEANLPYFDLVNRRLLDEEPSAGGRAIIDNLVAAGFAKGDMELTPDRTAIGLRADNLQFSVRLNGACLIGQNGNVGYHSVVAPLLGTGGCLVGETRDIDW